MQNSTIRYGLIAGFISILLTSISYSLGAEFMTKWWFGLLSFVIMILTYVLLALRIRKDNQGYISFKQAFYSIYTMCITGALLSTLFTMLLFRVVDPGFSKKMQDAIIETTVSRMEKYGVAQDKIDEVSDKLKEKGDFYSVKEISKGFLIAIVLYALLAIIIAASIKKEKPPFEEQPAEAPNTIT